MTSLFLIGYDVSILVPDVKQSQIALVELQTCVLRLCVGTLASSQNGADPFRAAARVS